MSDVLNIKPAPGRIVRDPKTMKPLAEAGETKPRISYWTRRLADGDVVLVKGDVNADEPAPAEAQATVKKGAK
ncbi:DUF2635 domain-containing protein [Salmonella enterica]|nr:DUF2635 domain-containing protein [Salmonella enterica]EDK0373701.1 hypothetical protein [Salmonella enterica]EFP3442032.1 DUF2635 domain-containing protein [Salmonella enterica]EGK8508528.1 DUF2635 domain-containing protein [Salmonella enterica]EJE6978090.1 DUF2635 domain-containing protein [Salmonella enterica]